MSGIKKKKILVVDDSPLLRGLIRQDLEDGGYSVIEAPDGISALVRVTESDLPDLITLDIEMPKLNGFETCKKIQKALSNLFSKSNTFRSVPVVFITSKDNLEDRIKGFDLGAADFISKPFEKGEVLEAVDKILNPQKRLRDLTALVVDDSSIARQIVQNSLSAEGLNIVEASDGDRAFEIMCNTMSDIDIVITDYEMPNMPGIDLCKKIRNELKLKELPIIFLTALCDISHVLDVFKAGATDYIVKPFVKEELVARVMAHLERGQLSRKLQNTIDQLRELNTMKDNLIAVCSHDLRTPLNSILGFTDILLEKEYLHKEDLKGLSQIKNSGEFLLSLINDILDLSKIKSSINESEMKPIMVSSITDISFNALKGLAEKKKQKLELKNYASNALVIGSQNSLTRVLNNLISNAIKFTQEGGLIEVTVSVEDKNDLSINVRDNGIGIAKENVPKLFDKFSSSSQSGTVGEKSTGLGLSIIKEIIEKHGGSIDVESVIGKGSCFMVKLPLYTGEIKAEAKSIEEEKTEAETEQEEEPMPNLKILIADDYEGNVILIRHFMKDFPFDIDIASNGVEAVDMFKKKSYDLIFMDIQMPEMDGCEATQNIREIEKRRNQTPVPVIAFSAADTEEETKKITDAGCNMFLKKPLKKETLFRTMKEVLRK